MLTLSFVVLENLNIERIKKAESEMTGLVVATHYYNPDDDREIKGINDPANIKEIYENKRDDESPNKDPETE